MSGDTPAGTGEELTAAERALGAVGPSTGVRFFTQDAVERILSGRRAGDGETTVEWGVRLTNPPDAWMARSHYYEGTGTYLAQNEEHARACAKSPTAGGTVIRRERTTYPDRVTDWQEVPADE